jgi:2-dehydropantoate 2-reductase
VGNRIAIMGAGALGSYAAAYLAREDEDVTIIDMWPEHVETIRKQGLRASGSQGDFTVPVKAMHLTDAQSITEPFDYAFISMKSYDTEWATHFIKRYVKPEGFFISLQNCWNDPVIGAIVGNDRELGCIASHIEVALWEPGHVIRGGEPGREHGHVVFRVGEQNGQITPRSEMIASKMDYIDAAYATDNLWGERWAKLCQNGMGNAISAMSTLGSQDMAQDPRCRLIRIHLAKEGAQVGLAQGLKVVDINGKPAQFWADADRGDVFEELDDFMSTRGGRVNWLASMAQDIKKGRHSEIDFMNGFICQNGREVGVPTPFNDAIVEAMHGVDNGTITPDPSVVEHILKVIGVPE